MPLAVILIFDVGKTNKKVLLFDEQYNLVYEEATQLSEIKDEDGFACEDVRALTNWVVEKYRQVCSDNRYALKAVNFTSYGASFVYLNEQLQVMLPLYNYLKPYPQALQQQFYNTYGGERMMARQTASPVLGSLNSGMQLYRLKYEQPVLFSKVKYALHLPQYLSFILSKQVLSDITSIGCHTNLWNFTTHNYHEWVYEEQVYEKLAPIQSADTVQELSNDVVMGIGLHDSSAALIPYIASFKEPFVLISTGTWCICLNPFNHTPLTDEELQQDCLCYLSYKGEPVKASRLFAGHEHEQQVKRLDQHFNKNKDYHTTLKCDAKIVALLSEQTENDDPLKRRFDKRDLQGFDSYEVAYHRLMMDIMQAQIIATKLVLTGDEKYLFVDGGFSKNEIYMQLLAAAFAEMKVCAAVVSQASALGAALVLQPHFGKKESINKLVELRCY